MPYFFSLPPITDLTVSQQAALNETGPIALSGGPGTGKSLVSLWRHIRNYSLNLRSSLLLTYTESLRFYLQNSCKAQNNPTNTEENKKRVEASKHIHRSYNWLIKICDKSYNEIIIDEGQDLGHNYYTKIQSHCDILSYGAHDSQMLYPPPPERATYERDLRKFFPNNRECILGENFRNSLEIMLFIRDFFEDFNIPYTTIQILRDRNMTGPMPRLVICDDGTTQLNGILEIIQQFYSPTHNIAILLPLEHQVASYHNLILQTYPDATYFTHKHWSEIDNVHVTTFKSSKGLEFDTVIIPDFQDYKSNLKNLDVVEMGDYYVAMTRARRNLYLLSSSDLDFIPETCQKEYLSENI